MEKFNIFISYSRKELDRVKQIKSIIEETTKSRCWMDLKAIESGSIRFTKDIVDGINQCQVFLFMLSQNSQDSKYALKELDFAEKKGKHVVIVNIDDCLMNDEFLFLYGLCDTISWNDESQRDKLLRDLKKWIGDEEVSDNILSNGNVDEWNRRGDDAYNVENYSEAVKWYKKAADKGDAYAQYFLGWMYDNGLGVVQSYSEAIKWYRNSAEQGYASAQNDLGWMYKNGYGVNQSYAEAVKWFKKSAEQENCYAYNNLGDMYMEGEGVNQDYDEAFKCYMESAKRGSATGQNNLGWMYRNGYGVSRNDLEAVKWYRKSAEQGDANAQNNLGLMYQFGCGVSQDYTEAIAWFRKSADQGFADAQFALGNMYESGCGVEKDYAEAVKWYKRAAGQGLVSAKKKLLELKN